MTQKYLHGEGPKPGVQEALVKPRYSKFGPQHHSTSIPWTPGPQAPPSSLLNKGLQSPGSQGDLRTHRV